MELGNVHEVAEITGLSESTLNKLRLNQPSESPPFVRIGRRVLYPLSGSNGLAAWISARTQGGFLGAGE